MPQIGRYPENISIREVLGMIRDTRPKATTVDEELVAALQLDKIMDKPMHTLSGGTRQKVSAVLAFLFDPPILILDEPTAGLDPLSVEILKEKTQQALARGKLLIITSHIMSDLDDMATELVYLHDGHTLFNDTIAALKVQTGQHRLGKAISVVMRSQLSIDLPSK
jgi:Cu-processing system ATP-binding protein